MTTDTMWTSRLRHRIFDQLPPDTLLPDEQPAYVASWIYVFGVLTLAALGVITVSGLWLAFEGPQWWHGSSVGHWVNSLHFWSVQIFFFVMIIHLWGKFWMAAWRGRRAMTWITGAVAFFASIGTAFSGYLVQTNFDSQWIAAEAKDGINSVGIGAWFNVLNVGQALLIHVALLPLVLVLLIVWHVLLVRRHGVVPPIDHVPDAATDGGPAEDPELVPWRGAKRRYDIVKEFAVAFVAVAVLTVALASLLSSPDEKAITLQKWATAAPADFVATAASELDGTSGTASYGAPYVNLPDAGQSIGPLHLQRWAGVRVPVDAAKTFVLDPLRTSLSTDPTLARAGSDVQDHGAGAVRRRGRHLRRPEQGAHGSRSLLCDQRPRDLAQHQGLEIRALAVAGDHPDLFDERRARAGDFAQRSGRGRRGVLEPT